MLPCSIATRKAQDLAHNECEAPATKLSSADSGYAGGNTLSHVAGAGGRYQTSGEKGLWGVYSSCSVRGAIEVVSRGDMQTEQASGKEVRTESLQPEKDTACGFVTNALVFWSCQAHAPYTSHSQPTQHTGSALTLRTTACSFPALRCEQELWLAFAE